MIFRHTTWLTLHNSSCKQVIYDKSRNKKNDKFIWDLPCNTTVFVCGLSLIEFTSSKPSKELGGVCSSLAVIFGGGSSFFNSLFSSSSTLRFLHDSSAILDFHLLRCIVGQMAWSLSQSILGTRASLRICPLGLNNGHDSFCGTPKLHFHFMVKFEEIGLTTSPFNLSVES